MQLFKDLLQYHYHDPIHNEVWQVVSSLLLSRLKICVRVISAIRAVCITPLILLVMIALHAVTTLKSQLPLLTFLLAVTSLSEHGASSRLVSAPDTEG